jgi:hypothetical protein
LIILLLLVEVLVVWVKLLVQQEVVQVDTDLL